MERLQLNITEFANPTWSGDIKEILLPHSPSFGLGGIPDNTQLLYEWWVYKDEQGVTLGLGWIDFDVNEYGQTEGEISLCVNTEYHGKHIGSALLAFLEHEVSRRGTSVTSVVVKRCNPEHDIVVNWFQGKNYEIRSDFYTSLSDTYMVKR
ncbi:GNAT family N-acetyltransferase [Bacillus thuringiensis]|uniref:GNAT family N-acetyltransferase n=1 Tax=Bacillus thuringiensis TaxID=1428 RepID=UPI0018B089DA|nr:GNAT family N-acetyltransferase [Bacillus thuringiensis]